MESEPPLPHFISFCGKIKSYAEIQFSCAPDQIVNITTGAKPLKLENVRE